jgi:hypothetical protein
MSFLKKYAFADKPKKKVYKDSETVVLDSIKDQRRILNGEAVKRNGKVVSSWDKDGVVTPRVSGLNLFDDGSGGSNTTIVSAYSTFLDDLEAAVKSGEIKAVLAGFDLRRSDRDARLRESRKSS